MSSCLRRYARTATVVLNESDNRPCAEATNSPAVAPVMRIRCRPQLANKPRRMCDGTKARLSIASPYVGSWEGRGVLGRHWFDASKINVRLLTDPEERVVNKDTALRLAEKGTIKKQRGLHARLFIVDDQVLLTSANLTYSAFARGHENRRWRTDRRQKRLTIRAAHTMLV